MKIILYALLFFLLACTSNNKKVAIYYGEHSSARIVYGAEKLRSQLVTQGYQVSVNTPLAHAISVILNINADSDSIVHESYSINTVGNQITIVGGDASGVMYGCLDLASKIREIQQLPKDVHWSSKPSMVLRGTCVGIQKPYYLPQRTVYEYPYTPKTFPWLYNKALWIKYLDMMAENKFNSLYLWNGHPFASLVKLKDYPFAVEVDDSTFKKNEDLYTFLTVEADRRGIWVIQMFYNIIVSKPFAEYYKIKTQDRSRPITPLIADYTKKSITAFIEKYPNVGLLVCLGEAMNTYEDDVEWFTKTIIPGVKDGLKALGRTDEPPIVLRAHDTNCKMVMKAALPIYNNLYTMMKYNGESLTTYEPRGIWSKEHKELSELGAIHIDNVHILANLEPFRYGSPAFIKKSVEAMRNLHGANAIHIYPQASYWDWPYTADRLADSSRLLEMDRDWIWYRAWGRYAWSTSQSNTDDSTYWCQQFNCMYGCGTAGKFILKAYDETGEIATSLIRKFGITEGNRQTFLLGMFMSQLVNPEKWTIYPDFFNSCGPIGEKLDVYITKEWNKEPHQGEIPPLMIAESVAHASAAVEAINKAEFFVTKNKEEFNRLKNDVYCYQAFANYFSEKIQAAMCVLNYAHSKAINNLDEAIPHLQKSIDYFKQLVTLTDSTYLYANSLQTQQRRIPIGGDKGKNKTWSELLPYYQTEFNNFNKNVKFLKKNGNIAQTKIEPLYAAKLTIENNTGEEYRYKVGVKAFEDKDNTIDKFAPELQYLRPIRFSQEEQIKNGTTLKIRNKKSINVLVGYFNTERTEYAKPPQLETNASANQYNQAEIKIANALYISKRGSVNIHSYSLPPGENILRLGKGVLLILGFTNATQQIISHNANVDGMTSLGSQVDWLFY